MAMQKLDGSFSPVSITSASTAPVEGSRMSGAAAQA